MQNKKRRIKEDTKRASEYLEKLKIEDEARNERMKNQVQLRLETIAEASKNKALKLK